MGIKLVYADNRQEAMKMRVDKFRAHINKAFDNRLKMNAEVCGFLIISPRHKATKCTVYFDRKVVATVGDGKFDVLPYDQKIFTGENKFKYDVLVEIQEELIGKIEEDDSEETVEDTVKQEAKEKPKKPAAKRKSSKRKSTKK